MPSLHPKAPLVVSAPTLAVPTSSPVPVVVVVPSSTGAVVGVSGAVVGRSGAVVGVSGAVEAPVVAVSVALGCAGS